MPHHAMNIVDSHCHASPIWYEPVESLLYEMEANGVAQAILIQINGQTHNDYQFDCLTRYPGRFASVVIVDTKSSDAPDNLRQLADRGASGVRLRPETRSPGDDPLAIWRTAEQLGIAVSCIGNAMDYASDDFSQLIDQVPDLNVVVEHLGALGSKSAEQTDEAIIAKVLDLARFPNVTIKVPGFGEFCTRAIPGDDPFPFERPIPNLIERVHDAFGPERMMWGSDYPPVSSREGYRNALQFPLEAFAAKPDAAKALIFGEVALRIFPVR